MGTRRVGTRSLPYGFYSDRGIAHLDTRIAGVRYRPSLHLAYDPLTASARDVRAVEEAAAKKYAELVAGRVLDARPGARVLTTNTLDELGGLWLLEAKKLWPKGYKTRITQLRNVTAWTEEAERFTRDKRTPLERIADDIGPTQYATDRLGGVLRDTVEKEISNLFAFLTWAHAERHISALPKRPELPRSAIGIRSGPQREKPVDVTEDEALAIIAELPEWAVRGGRGIQPGKPLPPKAFRVRDPVRLAWELGLRPGEPGSFEVPRHYVRGQAYVQFLVDSNKTGWDGRIPLTVVAREILERCAPDAGLIFGQHDLRNHIKAAAAKVLPPHKAKDFAAYDFRHGRAVHALEVTGDLLGTSRLLRHEQMTTTNRYIRTHERHVGQLVASLDLDRTRSGMLTETANTCASSPPKVCEMTRFVRRKGLEPLRFYPLAPQELAYQELRAVGSDLKRHGTSQNDGRNAQCGTVWSADGQDARAVALEIQRQTWDAFDAFSFAASES